MLGWNSSLFLFFLAGLNAVCLLICSLYIRLISSPDFWCCIRYPLVFFLSLSKGGGIATRLVKQIIIVMMYLIDKRIILHCTLLRYLDNFFYKQTL